MIKAYKEKVSSLMSKEDIKACANNEEKARNILFRYNGDDKEFLIKFLSDYSWWAGGKTLDRNDYYVSPILSLAGLVNASQSYIADICKNLAESELAYNILDESFSSGLGILSSNKSANDTLQLIYYGAPGTGKSPISQRWRMFQYTQHIRRRREVMVNISQRQTNILARRRRLSTSMFRRRS